MSNAFSFGRSAGFGPIRDSGWVLDRAITVLVANPVNSTAIVLIALVLVFVVAVVLNTLLASFAQSLATLLGFVVTIAPPMAAGGFTDIIRSSQNLAWHRGSGALRGFRRLGSQLALLAVFGTLLIISVELPAKMLSVESSALIEVGPWYIVISLAFWLIAASVTTMLVGLAAIAVCVLHWKHRSALVAITSSFTILFRRIPPATTLVLVLSLAIVRWLSVIAVGYALYWLHPTWQWSAFAAYRVLDVTFFTYATMAFAVCYSAAEGWLDVGLVYPTK